MSIHIGHRDALMRVRETNVYVRIGRVVTDHYVTVTLTADHGPGYHKGSQHLVSRDRLTPRKRGAHAKRSWWHVWG